MFRSECETLNTSFIKLKDFHVLEQNTYWFVIFIIRWLWILLFLKKLHIWLSRCDGNNDSKVWVRHVAILFWYEVLLSIFKKNSPITFHVISSQSNGLTSFFGFLTPQAVLEEVDDAPAKPGNATVDAGDGNLNVVQITVFVWSREVVRAEGAEQQGEKKIQNLWTDKHQVLLGLNFTNDQIIYALL